MMNEELEDAKEFHAALKRMDSLDAFDYDGMHKGNCDRLRAAYSRRAPKNTCGWPGCTSKDIKRSHTIAKSSGLGPLQHNSKVLMPNFTSYPVSMSPRGIKTEAAVFDGYCGIHENKFQVFEQNGVLESTSHAALQLFRSTAREFSNKCHRHGYYVELHREYSDVLMERPRKSQDSKLIDDVLRPLEDIMSREKNDAEALHKLWAACFTIASLNPADLSSFPKMVREMDVPTSRRIALSGSTFFDAQDGTGKSHRLPLVITMLPSATGVKLVFVTYEEAADQYEKMILKEIADKGSDAFVDEWLGFSDWWCADPQWWTGMPLAWRDGILTKLGSL